VKKPASILNRILPAAAVLAASHAPDLYACAACYGQSDSPMAEGMNWGILALLVVVGTVLSGITGFFVFIAKKNRKV
jgi:hypothetical protein